MNLLKFFNLHCLACLYPPCWFLMTNMTADILSLYISIHTCKSPFVSDCSDLHHKSVSMLRFISEQRCLLDCKISQLLSSDLVWDIQYSTFWWTYWHSSKHAVLPAFLQFPPEWEDSCTCHDPVILFANMTSLTLSCFHTGAPLCN